MMYPEFEIVIEEELQKVVSRCKKIGLLTILLGRGQGEQKTGQIQQGEGQTFSLVLSAHSIVSQLISAYPCPTISLKTRENPVNTCMCYGSEIA